MNEPVPLVDLGWQHRAVADRVAAGWTAVIERSAFIGGDEVAAFESAFAGSQGVAHCVAVGNGTDALELALRAAGAGRDDEVILPANTFVATALAVMRAGATPVLADVDPEHLLIDPADVERRIGPRTRAIVPVHLYGQCAPVEDLTRFGPAVIEDAAQAQGATRHGAGAGALGLAAGMSFYPSKNLGAYGDAGAVLTGDAAVAARVRALRNYGSEERYVHTETGFNSRMDPLQAVVLSAKLAHLAAWNDLRREAADRYRALLDGAEGVQAPGVAGGNGHVWYVYPVRVRNRDEVVRRLNAAGIGAAVHYPVPVHLQPAFAGLGLGPGSFPVAERGCAEVLSLPMFPGITEVQQERVVAALREALR